MIFPRVPTFESSESPVSFQTGAHPIARFFGGGAKDRWLILAHHPQVEGFVFFSQGRVSVAFFPTTTIILDSGGSSRETIGAVVGDPTEFQVLTVKEEALTSSAIHVVDPDQANSELEISTNIALFLQQNPPPSLDRFPKYAEDQDLALAQIPVVIPKIRGYPIVPGPLSSPETFDGVAAMHPLALE